MNTPSGGGHRAPGRLDCPAILQVTRPLPSAPQPSQWLLALFACLAGVLGVAAIWVVVAMLLGNAASWMALVAAVDAVVLLRLFGFPAGRAAALMAAAATLATFVLANWMIAATVVGRMMGLPMLASAQRLGVDHAWVLATMANGRAGFAMLALALLVAVAGGLLSGRRRGP